MITLLLSSSLFLPQPLAVGMCCNILPVFSQQLQMQRCVCQQLFTLSEVPVLGKKEPYLLVEVREVLPPGKPWMLGTRALVFPWEPGAGTSCRGRRPRLQACLSISLLVV